MDTDEPVNDKSNRPETEPVVDTEAIGRPTAVSAEHDTHPEDYDDFLDYLNDRFCGFTGS